MTEESKIGIKNIFISKGEAALTFRPGTGEGEINIEAHIPGYEVGEVMSNPAIFADILAHLINDKDKGLMKVFHEYTQRTGYGKEDKPQ